jgi:hypothetical protein
VPVLLLALVPYIVAIILYWQTASDLFADAKDRAPGSWSWRLLSPVLLGGLIPLALAARNEISAGQRVLLLTVTAAALVYTILGMAFLRGGERFFGIQTPVALSGHQFNFLVPWRLIVFFGSVILAYGATATVVVAGAG